MNDLHADAPITWMRASQETTATKPALETLQRLRKRGRTLAIVKDATTGKPVGIIAEETDAFVRLVANPLTDIDGTKIPKAKIKNRTAAPLSIMPTGLLNSYSKADLFDLMAYLRSLPAPKEETK